MAKTETQINLKINKGNYAKIQENLSQIGENELIIADDINIPLPDELNEGKGIISHNNKYVFEDVQLKNLITDIETHKTENGSYPSTKAVYDYCQTLGIPVLETAQDNWNISFYLTQDQLTFVNQNAYKTMLIHNHRSAEDEWYLKNEESSYSAFFEYNDYGNNRVIRCSINKSNGYVTFGTRSIENGANKKTSVASNSTSNTYYPTTKAVYDFVKSETKYIIVANYGNLPTTNVSNGTLAYCQVYYPDLDKEAGFYQYKNNTWNYIELENLEPIEISITGNFDVSQTYMFTIDSNDIFPLIKGASLVISFTGGGASMFHPNFFQTGQTTYTSSAVVVLNNTQYIATIDFDLSVQNNNATLSFQEIEGGSGGGGTGSSEKIYTYKMEWDSVDVGVGQTNILTFSVNENTLKGLPSAYQNLIDASDLVSAWNTIKAGVSGGSQDAFYQAMVFITMLSSFTFNKSLVEFDDNIDGSMRNITAITAVLGNDQTLEFSSNSNSDSVNHYSMPLNNFFASTITLLGSVGGSSSDGSGEGSGSGKLYELSMELTRYDENGDVVQWVGTAIQENNLPLTFNIYESNFEKIKVIANNLIDFINNADGTNMPHIEDINGLVQFINTMISETLPTASAYASGILITLVNLCDKAYITGTGIIPVYYIINADPFNLSYQFGNNVCPLNLSYSDDNDDVYYALNVNNSCTLTEYGTSGGGGASATRTKYHIEVADSNDHKAIIPIYKDDFDKYLVEMNQVGQAMATAMGITWTTLNTIADIKNLFDAQKSTQLAYGCDLAMNLLVKYAYESGENPLLTLTNSTREQAKVVNEMLNYDLSSLQTPLAYPLGAITSISYDPETIVVPNTTVGDTQLYYWFKTSVGGNSSIEIDQDATLTYTEEQVEGGSGGSGSEDTGGAHTKYTVTAQYNTNELKLMLYFLCNEEELYSDLNAGFALLNTQLGISLNTNCANESDIVGNFNILQQIDTTGGSNPDNNSLVFSVLGLLARTEKCIKVTMPYIAEFGTDLNSVDVIRTNGQVGGMGLYYVNNSGVNTPIDVSAFVGHTGVTYGCNIEEIDSGSSSSQPTIPERFSLAYNLVVNINQQQFANGSWTGSNSDNIRTFQYNGSNADETKAKELVEFLTGVNVLDSYNATKPTPCFVFCTQSNICWKLQWDNSLLHAYKVENFPFVVKEKYYTWRLVDEDNTQALVLLFINIPYEVMQDVYDKINQALGGNISTPQEVIGVYNSLKADNISAQSYGMLLQLFNGVAQSCLSNNLNNLIMLGNADGFYKINGSSITNGITYLGSTEIFSQTLSANKISFTSGSVLTITEKDEDKIV